MIGLGLLDESTGSPSYSLRLQSIESSEGQKNSGLLVATSPMQVTAVQYSSDARIKTDVEDVDEDSYYSE
jgi:hypothetical protein